MYNIGTLASNVFGLPNLSEKEVEELLKDNVQDDITDVEVNSETEVVPQPLPAVITVGVSVVEPTVVMA